MNVIRTIENKAVNCR